jgi:outer membrane protein TolC
MALIKVDTVKAELERDRKLLEQKEELFRKNAIPPIELEVARLKDIWNQKQLIVAEKSLATVAAQYEAMKKMTQHFGGVEIPVADLYAIFRRAWDAGCDKGPDEVVAMKAWADYARKSLERAQLLNRDGNASFASVLEKEAQYKTAQSNYQQRQSRLDRCRKVLFPSLDEIRAIERR